MAAFNFPDPLLEQTVTNPITGSYYQWKEPPGKWVITTKVRAVQDIIYEGDTPPSPRGDYKLWYSTDTLELYFWYEDVNDVGAWVPTSVPIQVLEDLNAFAAQAEVDIDQLQYKQQLLQNAVDQIYLDLQQQDDYVKKVGGDEMEGPLQITGSDADLNLSSGSEIQSNGTKVISIDESGASYHGAITDNNHLVNKQYVDDKLQIVLDSSARLYRAVDGPPGPKGEIYLGYYSGNRHVLNLSSTDLADQDKPNLNNVSYVRILGDGVDELGVLEEGTYFMRSEPYRLRLVENVSYLLRFF